MRNNIQTTKPKSVVMIDDNKDNQKIYKHLFENSNYKFTFINNSLTFLNNLNNNKLNTTSIIILDYNIDEHYHGLNLLKKMREKKLFTPAILFSSSASDELKRFDFSSLLPVFYLDKIDFSGKKLLIFCESLLYNIK